MQELREACASVLKTPLRMLIRWVQQDDDRRTAARFASDLRRRCREYLDGDAPTADVQWIPEYVRSCRREYRNRYRDSSLDAPGELVVAPEETGGEHASRLLQLIDRSVASFCTTEQKRRYASFRKHGQTSSESLSRRHDVSRVTMHQSIQQARYKGLAGVLLVAGEDESGAWDDVLFSNEFVAAIPFHANVMNAFDGISRSIGPRRREKMFRGLSRLWEKANRFLVEELADGVEISTLTRLMHSAYFVHDFAARWGGKRFESHIAETWNLLSGTPAFDCVAFRRLYATAAAHCGVVDHHLEGLREGQSRQLETAAIIGFVRTIATPGTPTTTQAWLSDPYALYQRFAKSNDNPLEKSLAYVSRCIHDPHYDNPALSRMLLTWADGVTELMRDNPHSVSLKQRGATLRSLEQYRKRLCATDDHAAAWERVSARLIDV